MGRRYKKLNRELINNIENYEKKEAEFKEPEVQSREDQKYQGSKESALKRLQRWCKGLCSI